MIKSQPKKEFQQKKSEETSLISVNKTANNIIEIDKSFKLNKSKRTENNSYYLVGNVLNETTDKSISQIHLRGGKNNTSLNNQTSIISKNNNNSSFQNASSKNKSKSNNKSKKKQLENLLMELKKFTPEINLLLKKEDVKVPREEPLKIDEANKSPNIKKKKISFKKKKSEKSEKKLKKKKKITLEKTENLLKKEKKEIPTEKNENLIRVVKEKNQRLGLEKLLFKQKNQENEKKKQEKLSSILEMNENIRKNNKIRFVSLPKKKYQGSKSQDVIKKKKFKKPKKLDENQRREQLGLSWLNNIEKEHYEKIIERNRSRSKEASNEKNAEFISFFNFFFQKLFYFRKKG